MRSQKGITLVALIITIIVLLILAVVTIGAITNQGIINHAVNAKDDYNREAQEEAETLNMLQNYMVNEVKDVNDKLAE